MRHGNVEQPPDLRISQKMPSLRAPWCNRRSEAEAIGGQVFEKPLAQHLRCFAVRWIGTRFVSAGRKKSERESGMTSCGAFHLHNPWSEGQIGRC